MAVQCAPGAQ